MQMSGIMKHMLVTSKKFDMHFSDTARHREIVYVTITRYVIVVKLLNCLPKLVSFSEFGIFEQQQVTGVRLPRFDSQGLSGRECVLQTGPQWSAVVTAG
jgi:hypothetical protein